MTEWNNQAQGGMRLPKRFTIPQRIEHAILVLLFTILAFTGLIQKCAANPVAYRLIEWLGGIEPTRIIHRWAAALFALLFVYHIIVLAYKTVVPRVAMTMMPCAGDFRDALHLLQYNLSLRGEPPQMPRYTFIEKLEYWSLIWGSAIMIATGLMLWNPLFTAKYLSGQFIPAAIAAHGAEAVLAVLSIAVWHIYHVHIKSLNKSMFTGMLTMRQMEEEHGSELKQLIGGEAPPAPDRRERCRRMVFFAPIAIVIAAAGVITIYWTATAQKSAIAELQPAMRPAVSMPTSKLASPSTHFTTVSAPLISHQIEGRRQCKKCHVFPGIKSEPANHGGRPLESCQICHRPAPARKPEKTGTSPAKSGQPGPIPHSTEGDVYGDCALCHKPGGIQPYPAGHSDYLPEGCHFCHKAGTNR